MHIVKVKQYDTAFAVKSKSSSHLYHHCWFLSPEATAVNILLEIFYACTNTHFCLEWYMHICIYAHTYVYSIQNKTQSFAAVFPC